MREYGCDRDVKTVDECVAIEPALAPCRDRLAGGIFTATDESGDAQRVHRRSSRSSPPRAASRFRCGTTVESLVADGDAHRRRARASSEEHAHGSRSPPTRYVVALGSYSPFLLAPLGVPCLVYPAKGYSATIDDRRAPRRADGVADRPRVEDRVDAPRRPAARRRHRGAVGLRQGLEPRALRGARQRARSSSFPTPATRDSAQFWTGLRPATPSNVPLVGATRYRNLLLDTGHGTLGWTMACGSGRALADVIAGRKPASISRSRTA